MINHLRSVVMKKLIPLRMVTKPPPPFIISKVVDIVQRTPRLTMITAEGEALDAMVPDDPGASIRLLLPREHAGDELEMPTYDGNVFRYDDGELSTARTLTPMSAGRPNRMMLGVIDHGAGRLSKWLSEVQIGDTIALAGPGPAYTVDRSARRYLVAGDESAVPAISQLLESIPDEIEVEVCIEVTTPAARTELPTHPRATVTWTELADGAEPSTTLVRWVDEQTFDEGTRLWVAGEAAAVQKIRKLDGVARDQANIRGYWKLRD